MFSLENWKLGLSLVIRGSEELFCQFTGDWCATFENCCHFTSNDFNTERVRDDVSQFNVRNFAACLCSFGTVCKILSINGGADRNTLVRVHSVVDFLLTKVIADNLPDFGDAS